MHLIRRILAWIALLFFIFIVANILFIHIYVTESVTIFLIYTLVFMFGYGKNLFQPNPVQNRSMENPEQPANPDADRETGIDGEPANPDIDQETGADGD
jgi:hypothetical protein